MFYAYPICIAHT